VGKVKEKDRNVMKGEIRTKKDERKGKERMEEGKLIQKANVRIQERRERTKKIKLYAPHHEDVLGSGGIAPSFLTSALDGAEWST
jgi:hypothetical protein